MGKENSQSITSSALAEFKSLDIAPPLFDNLPGWPSILRVGEMAHGDFYESIARKRPNGYIVGVGTGVILTLTQSFSKGVLPRGIVITDVNPKVVAFVEVLTDALASFETKDDFTNNFFLQPKEEYEKKLKAKMNCYPSPKFQEQVSMLESMDQFHDSPIEIWKELKYVLRGDMIPVPQIVLNQFDVLYNLALNGSIVSIYTDISDPRLSEAVSLLPDYQTSTNVVYVSSAATYSDKGPQGFWRNVSNFGSNDRIVYIEAASEGQELYLKDTDPQQYAA